MHVKSTCFTEVFKIQSSFISASISVKLPTWRKTSFFHSTWPTQPAKRSQVLPFWMSHLHPVDFHHLVPSNQLNPLQMQLRGLSFKTIILLRKNKGLRHLCNWQTALKLIAYLTLPVSRNSSKQAYGSKGCIGKGEVICAILCSLISFK